MLKSGVTVREVANQAGVSKTTAAYVLSNTPGFRVHEETRQRIQSVAAELGYRRNGLATALFSGRTYTVGVVLPFELFRECSPSNQTYAKDMTVALADAATQQGLRLTLMPLASRDANAIAKVCDNLVDGLILVSMRDTEIVRRIYSMGVPCIEVGSGCGSRIVRGDNDGGVEAAMGHLVSLGHRRIIHWHGQDGNSTAFWRGEAFQKVVLRHGLSPEESFIAYSLEEIIPLLKLPPAQRPTAIFTFNDRYAFRVLEVARDLGLCVPRDLSVVGFDDSIIAQIVHPALTTIYYPIDEMAETAIQLLKTLCQSEKEITLPPPIPVRLVVRESTAPAPEL